MTSTASGRTRCCACVHGVGKLALLRYAQSPTPVLIELGAVSSIQGFRVGRGKRDDSTDHSDGGRAQVGHRRPCEKRG